MTTRTISMIVAAAIFVGCDSQQNSASSPLEQKIAADQRKYDEQNSWAIDKIVSSTPTADHEASLELGDILTHFDVKSDKIDHLIFLEHRNAKRVNALVAYIGCRSTDGASRSQEPPWLRIRVWYDGPNWLFANAMTVVAGEQRIDVSPVDFNRQVGGSGQIYEISDFDVTRNQFRMLQTLSVTGSGTLRIRGNNGTADFDITSSDCDVIRDVLTAYKELGGIEPASPQ